MLLDSCAIISRRDPLTSVREAVFLMLSNYISLMQAMDEPEIDGVEHAVMLAFFSPQRIAEAAAWGLANNYGGENMVRWLRDHPGHSLLFDLLNMAGPGPTVH